MNATISLQDIESQITTDIAACKTLLDLLNEEKEALKARDADSLAGIIERKLSPLTQLEESAKQRALWVNVSEQDKSTHKWDNFLKGLNKDSLKQRWEQLKKLTRECQQQNEVNGKILSRQQQIYGRLFGLLRGQTAAPGLYNASGATTSNHYSMKFDEA